MRIVTVATGMDTSSTATGCVSRCPAGSVISGGVSAAVEVAMAVEAAMGVGVVMAVGVATAVEAATVEDSAEGSAAVAAARPPRVVSEVVSNAD